MVCLKLYEKGRYFGIFRCFACLNRCVASIVRIRVSGATVFEEAEHLRSTFDMIKDMDVVGLLTGLSLQRVGGICSIIVVCCMVLFIVYHVVIFVFKVIIVYGAEDSYYLAAVRALCTSVHLIQEDSNARIRARNAENRVKENLEMEGVDESKV